MQINSVIEMSIILPGVGLFPDNCWSSSLLPIVATLKKSLIVSVKQTWTFLKVH